MVMDLVSRWLGSFVVLWLVATAPRNVRAADGVPENVIVQGKRAANEGDADWHVQTFNGIESPECRDVGLVLGLPAGDTVPGAGASPSDLAEVASGPFHALIDVTAKRLDDEYRVLFRFEPSRTTTTFGGCYPAREKGVRIVPDERQEMSVLFAVEQLFRDSTGSESATMRLSPFIDADERGNRDHIVTMDELDTMNLAYATVYASSYELPDLTGARASFGDFVRWLFRSTVQFRDADGACVGNDPGK